MSKAGLIHLGENLKADLLKTNIKIQVINPGFVKTRLTDKNYFKMPGLISAEEAAEEIAKIMVGPKFITHFPGWFGRFMGLLKYLPRPLYFWLVSKI
jgi:short-subunit dehydrogenase